MKPRAMALLVLSWAWIALALLFLCSRVSLSLPTWIPLWLEFIGVISFEVVPLLGWLVPLAAGIRILMKARNQSSPLPT
jgi:hypothetical protein